MRAPQNFHPWGPSLSKSACCPDPGDVVIAGLAVVLGFLAAAGFLPPRGRGSSWSPRTRAAARRNELDAGERRPMIASEESPLGCGLPWTGGWLPGGRCASPAEWSHIHPFGRPPGRGP